MLFNFLYNGKSHMYEILMSTYCLRKKIIKQK